MTVYAPTPGFADRRPHPRTLVLIVAGHAALIAAVMAAKMDLPQRLLVPPTIVDLIPLDDPPPPEPQPQRQHVATARQLPSEPVRQVELPIPSQDPIETSQTMTPTPLPPFPGAEPAGPNMQIVPEPVRTGPRFATPTSELRPPYPESKRRLEEEAVLKLRLAIDARGRITAVQPVGAADPDFLQSARRHIIAHWRYKPATEDGRAVASSTVITLRFELDD